MRRDERRALIALTVLALIWIALLFIFSWAEDGAFIVPVGNEGWIYHYQGLVAGLLALAGAGLTVWQLRRDQRGQARRFEEQMELATRADRLRVARETRRLITNLEIIRRQMLDSFYDPDRRDDLDYAMARLEYAAHEREFYSALEPLLDEDFLIARRAMAQRRAVVVALLSRPSTMSDHERAEWLATLPDNISLLAASLGAMIDVLQQLRQTYLLPEVSDHEL